MARREERQPRPQTLETVRAERVFAGGAKRYVLELHAGKDTIPAILTIPPVPLPVPAALLLHGYRSRKEHLSESLGVSLMTRGVATLAIDLPLHGERVVQSGDRTMRTSPLELARQWKHGVEEARWAFRWLALRPEIQKWAVGVIGYSMGSFLGLTVAAQEPAVRAMVVAAGGDLPADLPFAPLVRQVVDPIASVKQLDGRPLLVVHGRSDTTVHPAQAERLFAAAEEPKEMKWYDAGHYLPDVAISEASDWLAARLGERRTANGGRVPAGGAERRGLASES